MCMSRFDLLALPANEPTMGEPGALKSLEATSPFIRSQ